MKRYFFTLAMILMAFWLVSCEKESEVSHDGTFEFNNELFPTLQDAVNAALLNQDGQVNFVFLKRDAKGGGAVVADGLDKILGIDFGGYEYSLSDGGTIDFGNADAYLKGSGGKLSGKGAVLRSKGGSLHVENLLNIDGDIETSSYTRFEKDYSGKFSGNITLEDEEAFICSPKGEFNIPLLTVKGEDAFLQVETAAAPEKPVEIGKVSSTASHPVSMNQSGAVRVLSGSSAHVHKFTTNIIAATCVSPQRVEEVCGECAYVNVRIDDQALGECPKELLTYVPGYAARLGAPGMVEHWECPLCGRCYSDKDGEHEITGPVIIPPLNYLTDSRLLHSMDNFLTWKSEYPSEFQLGEVITIIGFVAGILGTAVTIGLGIPSLVMNDDMLFNDVCSKLDLIQESLDRIEYKIDQLARKIDVVPYKELIISRTEKFQFLSSKSMAAVRSIEKCIKDESKSEDEKMEMISDVIDDWKNNVFGGTQIADLTQSLMQQYVYTGIEADVPRMFEAVANSCFMWEHEGYDFRYQAMAWDVASSVVSYLLSGFYISSVKAYSSEDMRAEDIKTLKNVFDAYSKTVLDEISRIKDRDAKYRRYNPNGITFSRDVKRYDFRNWFATHRDKGFPRSNDDGVAVTNCEKILSDLGLSRELALTPDMALDIYHHYNQGNDSPASIYAILSDSVGFRNLPRAFDPAILFVKRNDAFTHLNSDSALPVYKIFHWEVYRSHNNQDFFGIWSSLNDRCVQENHNILYFCDISSYSSGQINSLGEETRWDWYSLVKVDE